jgi:dihydroorotate dehydrogenase (fumarate)
VGQYLDLIAEAKRAVSIPVIASVHCMSAGSWVDFAKRAEQAGADALELNVFVMPSDPRVDGREIEQLYFEIVDAVKQQTSIPLSIKLGFFFSGLHKMLVDLSNSQLDGMVLFNRFYCPDIDLEKLELRPSRITSSPDEYTRTLRWCSILSGHAGCDLAATTGIHDGNTVAKMLLAGADAVQIVSAFYKHGLDRLAAIRGELEQWMGAHDFGCLADFKGKLSQDASANPAAWVRVQFMKASVGIE